MFKPLFNRVSVRVMADEVSPGGILLPAGAGSYELMKGVVQGIGPDVKHVKIGDTVVFSRYGSAHLDTHKLHIVRDAEIMGVID